MPPVTYNRVPGEGAEVKPCCCHELADKEEEEEDEDEDEEGDVEEMCVATLQPDSGVMNAHSDFQRKVVPLNASTLRTWRPTRA